MEQARPVSIYNGVQEGPFQVFLASPLHMAEQECGECKSEEGYACSYIETKNAKAEEAMKSRKTQRKILQRRYLLDVE